MVPTAAADVVARCWAMAGAAVAIAAAGDAKRQRAPQVPGVLHPVSSRPALGGRVDFVCASGRIDPAREEVCCGRNSQPTRVLPAPSPEGCSNVIFNRLVLQNILCASARTPRKVGVNAERCSDMAPDVTLGAAAREIGAMSAGIGSRPTAIRKVSRASSRIRCSRSAQSVSRKAISSIALNSICEISQASARGAGRLIRLPAFTRISWLSRSSVALASWNTGRRSTNGASRSSTRKTFCGAPRASTPACSRCSTPWNSVMRSVSAAARVMFSTSRLQEFAVRAATIDSRLGKYS